MELTNQVATLQDEVKLLKGEIKSILKEIRTAVLSRDNPFAAGMEALASDHGGSTTSSPQADTQDEPVTPGVPELTLSTPSAPKFNMPTMPMMGQQHAPVAPAWAAAIPPQQPAPAPFMPAAAPAPAPAPAAPAAPAPAPAPPPSAPAAEAPGSPPSAPAAEAPGSPAKVSAEPSERSGPERPDTESVEDEDARKPIPIRRKVADELEDVGPEAAPVPQRQQPSWSLPALAGLAVWAEDALLTLGPRRFHFVLDLATFAELISTEAREVLSGLIDADSLSQEAERPLNVNECLVVLRQLDAIVHGEKIVKLPRRRGIRHRRVR